MKTLFRNCIYIGKDALMDPGLVFWSLVYPIILVTFFYTAFSGIINEEFKGVTIGIEKENAIISALEEINIVKVMEITGGDAPLALEDGQIDGFISRDLDILVASSGINQSIIKEIVEQIKQMNYLGLPIENYNFEVNYIRPMGQEANPMLIIFYSLIGMMSTYGVFVGIVTVSLAQGNLSDIGARLNMTPLRKESFLLAGTMVALTLNLISNALLLIFIEFILKINLFTEIKYSILLIILGNLFGISLGIFIGASNKQSFGVKSMISIVITLFLSFLSGMMSPGIKIKLDNITPLFGKLNPISILTNNLYKINLLGNTQGVWGALSILGVYSITLLLLSYVFLRGRSYDSL